MDRKIAHELECLSQEIRGASEALVLDKHVLARHLRVLQGFDHSIQVLDGLTAVLRSDDVDTAILHCVPGDLAMRLRQ